MTIARLFLFVRELRLEACERECVFAWRRAWSDGCVLVVRWGRVSAADLVGGLFVALRRSRSLQDDRSSVDFLKAFERLDSIDNRLPSASALARRRSTSGGRTNGLCCLPTTLATVYVAQLRRIANSREQADDDDHDDGDGVATSF